MKTTLQVRLSGLAGILAGAFCLVHTLLVAPAWYNSVSQPWASTPPFVRAVGPVVEGLGLLSFAANHVVYYVYGRLFFLTYLLAMLAVVAFHVRQSNLGSTGRYETRSFQLLVVGIVASLVGNVTAYWTGNRAVFTPLQQTGFWIEFVGVLLLLAGTTLYGLATLRLGIVPPWTAWTLVLAAPTGILCNVLLVGYVPNGVLVPFCLAWAAVGHYLWTGTPRQTEAPTESDAANPDSRES